jgi:amino acid permease
MDANSAGKTERLAKVSRILGVLSFGLLVITSLFLLWIKFSNYDEFRKLALLGWAFILLLSSFILGISGCIVAITALRNNKAEGDNPKIKKIALTGLVLGGLVIAIVLALISFVFFFGYSNTPPMPITPSPPIPLPNGG